MPTALAISPHLDDAVFSAGGTLVRYTREDWRVVVATVFTASIPDPTGFALACQLDKGLPAEIDYMALRRDEDAEACAIIGAKPIWLPFPEAPHRSYDSSEALFDGLRGDDDIVGLIAPALVRLIEIEAPDIVLAPQAVGAHVDHIAVYLALLRCDVPMRLWIDFPYAMRPTPRASPFVESLSLFQQQVSRLEDYEIRTKRIAISRYSSQLQFQFGGLAQAQDAVLSDGGTERFALRSSERLVDFKIG